jgi:two-component system phosphate regulon sensor histidine kinase PhoR
MKKFRFRLTLIFIVLIGSSVLAAGVFMARMLETSHIEALKGSMLRELRLIVAVGWHAEGSEAEQLRFLTERVNLLKETAGARVTFIGMDGKVLADSDSAPATMDNHLKREEISGASASGIGYSQRYSDTVKQNMLYAAVPIQEGGLASGYVRLAISLADVERSIRNVWAGLIVGLLIVFVAAALICYRAALGMTRPIDHITYVARQITKTNYKARVAVRKRDEIGELGEAINRMADSLQLQVNQITENESRLKSVLENMDQGILFIDRDERIVLLNRLSEEILGFYAAELLG